MPVQSPTILVKKADGTSVRLTLEEFKKYQTERGKRKEERGMRKEERVISENVKNQEVRTKLEEKTQDKRYETRLLTSERSDGGQVRDKREEVKKHWKTEDTKPLLAEKIEEKPKVAVAAVLPDKRENVYTAILKSLRFPLPDELFSRLQSLVVSRLKDIRTDEQITEYAGRPVDKGGLGLNPAQAQELVQAIGKELGVKRVVRNEETGKLGNLEIEKKAEKIEDRGYETRLLTSERSDGGQVSDKKRNFGVGKPVLHDIVAPASTSIAEEKHTIGPLEELQNMTLIDFRRLAPQAETAGKILQGKFVVLKQDSYLLYLHAVKAWYNSPLYRAYVALAGQALTQNKKVKELISLQGQSGLQEAEFMALVEVCSSL
jgi:hypothetical protein